MEITCSRESLASLLKPVTRVIPTRHILPADGWLLLEAATDSLRITGGNPDCQITTTIEAECLQAGAIAVAAHSFLELISNLQDPQLSIQLVEQVDPKRAVHDHHLGILSVTCGVASSTFNTMNHHDFNRRTAPPDPDDTNSIMLDAPPLDLALQRALITAKELAERPCLGGINFTTANGHLHLASSDATRLTVSRLQPINPGPDDWDIIVPAGAIRHLRSLLGDTPVTIILSPDEYTVTFRTGPFELSSALIAGDYINWQDLGSQVYKWSFRIDPDHLQNLAASATAFSHQDLTPLRFSPPDTGQGHDPDRIYSHCVHREVGSIDDSAPVLEITGDPHPIHFFYNNVRDIGRMKLDSAIELCIPDFNAAVNIHMPDNPDFYHLVVPMVVQEP